MSDPAQNTRARAALRGEWLPGMVDCDGNRVTAAPSPTPNPYGCSASWVHDGETESCGDDPCPFCGWEPDDVDDPPEGWGEPDLDDPVTALALLVVLRRRVGAPLAQVSPALDDGAFWVCYLNDGSDRSFRGPTEADALLAALEAT